MWDYSDPCVTFPTILLDLAVDSFFLVFECATYRECEKETLYWPRGFKFVFFASGGLYAGPVMFQIRCICEACAIHAE